MLKLLGYLFCYVMGLVTMGATVYNVQENLIVIFGIYFLKQIFVKIFVEPSADKMGIPIKGAIKTIFMRWLQERDNIQHYLASHAGMSYRCDICNQKTTP